MNNKLFANDNPVLQQRAKALRREMSEAEQGLWLHLRAGRLNGCKFRRQQPVGRYIADFVCVSPKLIIEADGGQANTQNKRLMIKHAPSFSKPWALPCCGFGTMRF